MFQLHASAQSTAEFVLIFVQPVIEETKKALPNLQAGRIESWT